MTAGAARLAVPLLAFQPTPPLEEFVADRSPLIALRAANGIGKSYTSVYKLVRLAVGKPGARLRIVGPTRAQVRQVTGRYLWELLQGYLRKGSMWRPGTGWNRNNTPCLANGSEIELRSYEDPPQAQEGDHRHDCILLDEVPPQAHLEANLGRAGQVIVSFTIQSKRPPDYLKKIVEGDEDSPTAGRATHATGWTQYVIPFLRENVPFLDDLKYHQKVKKWQGTEAEARRIWAAWESSSESRTLGGWSARCIKTREQILAMLRGPSGQIRTGIVARYGIDHGTGVGKQCQYLILALGNRYFVVDEYVGNANSTPAQSAVGIRDAIVRWFGPGVAGLYRIDRIYGDVNSSGPAGAGTKLNQLIAWALCSLYGIEVLPQTNSIQAPVKAEGFKEAREAGLNHAMLEGRFFVLDECRGFIRAAQQYEGNPRDPHKDKIDGVCYAIQDLLLGTPMVQSGAIRR